MKQSHETIHKTSKLSSKKPSSISQNCKVLKFENTSEIPDSFHTIWAKSHLWGPNEAPTIKLLADRKGAVRKLRLDGLELKVNLKIFVANYSQLGSKDLPELHVTLATHSPKRKFISNQLPPASSEFEHISRLIKIMICSLSNSLATQKREIKGALWI